MVLTFGDKTPEIGEGSYVSPTATVIGDVKIGRDCYIGHNAVVRGDYSRIEIGDGTAVEEGAVVHCPPGRTAVIGSHVTIGHNAVAHSAVIEDWAVIGMCAVTSIDSVIGSWAFVAEGAVVKQRDSVPAGIVAAGTPAKAVRPVSEKDKALWTELKQVYSDLAHRYLASPPVIVETS